MNKRNAETRKKLKSMESVKDFEELLSRLMATEEEKQIMLLHYRDGKTLSYIADIIGMSESNIKKKHHILLMKIGNIV